MASQRLRWRTHDYSFDANTCGWQESLLGPVRCGLDGELADSWRWLNFLLDAGCSIGVSSWTRAMWLSWMSISLPLVPYRAASIKSFNDRQIFRVFVCSRATARQGNRSMWNFPGPSRRRQDRAPENQATSERRVSAWPLFNKRARNHVDKVLGVDTVLMIHVTKPWQ